MTSDPCLTDFAPAEQVLLVYAYAYEVLGVALTTDALFDGAAYTYDKAVEKNIKGFHPYTGQWVQDYVSLPGLDDAAKACVAAFNEASTVQWTRNTGVTVDFKVLYSGEVLALIPKGNKMIEPRNHYIVFDYESQILPDGDVVGGPCVATRKRRHMSPYAGAHAPYLGYQEKGDERITIVRHIGSTPGTRSLPALQHDSGPGADTILVGHNIGFDLHHLFADVAVDEIPPFTIWDTQTAEYYLEAQRPDSRWTKLKNADGCLADRYGVDHGEDGLVKYFDAGLGADKIPPDEVSPYLCADVRVTHQVFILQFQRAVQEGMLEFLREMMDAQCAMILMEKAGMPVDGTVAGVIETSNAARMKELDEILNGAWVDYFPLMKPAEVDKHGKPKPGTRNPGSNMQLLQVLTSGTYKYQKSVQQLDDEGEPAFFKNGKPRMKLETHEAQVQNGGSYSPTELTEVGEDTLSKMEGLELVDLVIERRKVHKTVDTYCNGYLRKTNPDGCLRTSYNQTATPSGRASSSNPNLQNLPKK